MSTADDPTPTDRPTDRFERGLQMMTATVGEDGANAVASLDDIAPDLGHQIVAWGFGEIYSRPALPPRDRQLVTIGILTALGGCEPQLEVHIKAGLNVGLTPEQIVEALMHSAAYCGFPKALNAVAVAKKVFGERGLLPVKTTTV